MFGANRATFGFLVLVFQVLSQTCFAHPPKITIYYETLCPYCKNFFAKQIEPMSSGKFRRVASSATWNLIPYGNANTERDPNGNVSITCQHGKKECRGNTIQACVLKKVSDPLKRLWFCSCFMVNNGNQAAFESCAEKYALDYNVLNTCVISGEGLKYLAAYGVVHKQANPRGVPTFDYNGHRCTKQENSAIHKNTCQFICNKLKGEKPKACNLCSTIIT